MYLKSFKRRIWIRHAAKTLCLFVIICNNYLELSSGVDSKIGLSLTQKE